MIWRVTWPYLKAHWHQVAAVIILQVISTICALFLPDLNASIIDEGVVTGDVNRVWVLGAVMLAVSAAQGITAGFAVYLAALVAMGLGADLRSKVFTRVQEFSSREVHDLGAPSLKICLRRGFYDAVHRQQRWTHHANCQTLSVGSCSHLSVGSRPGPGGSCEYCLTPSAGS